MTVTLAKKEYRNPRRPTSRPSPGRRCGKQAAMLILFFPLLIPLALVRTIRLRRAGIVGQ
jgi:hypothetical protein